MANSAKQLHRQPRIWALAATVSLLLVVCVGGCGQRHPPGSIEDLFVSNKRYNVDRERGIVRVFAQVVNEGEGLVRQVKMEAVLLSADGQKRGTNNTILTNIKPGEKRDFSIVVTSHSHSQRVEITAKQVE